MKPESRHKNTTGLLTGGIVAFMLNQIIVWQAYNSPASLGFPLSLPAACGLYEIFHLKQLSG